MKRGAFLVLIACLFLVNCSEDDLPLNPYNGIEDGDTTLVIDTLNRSSFVNLHKTVLVPSCNVLGCHDGSFEPDFRTVESSYNTMVYHPIIKNNIAEEFTYRVIPFDTGLSLLHERLTNCCFVNQDDRMPQDNIGSSLSQQDLAKVTDWILSGAKDISGIIPEEPNSMPNVDFFYVANSTFDSTYSDYRIGQWYEPFLIPSNETVNFIFRVSDDMTMSSNMEVNKLYISDQMDEFSSAVQAIATSYDFNYDVWIVPFNTSGLQSGKQYYFRYEINDADNVLNTVKPNNNSSFVIKSYYSFILQ